MHLDQMSDVKVTPAKQVFSCNYVKWQAVGSTETAKKKKN